MFLTIFTILGSLIPSILTNSKVISSSTGTLISNLINPVQAMIAAIQNGSSKSSDALAVLAAISGVITVLKGETNLPADTLTQINNLDLDVQKALAAYVQAEKGLDLTIYQPIQPV